MEKIEINKWYVDSEDVIFWLYKIDEKEKDYHGYHMNREEGIWYKFEIKRLATDTEIESMNFKLRK